MKPVGIFSAREGVDVKRGGGFVRPFCWILAGSCRWRPRLPNCPRRLEWLVGKHFDQRLRQQTDLTCVNASLGVTLKNLATNNQLAIVLDRRIDPNQTLSVTIAGQPLEDVLRRVAEIAGSRAVAVGADCLFRAAGRRSRAAARWPGCGARRRPRCRHPRRQAFVGGSGLELGRSGHAARSGRRAGERSPSEDRGTRPDTARPVARPGGCRRWPGSIA